MSLPRVPKDVNPNADLIKAFLEKGGKITRAETKPMASELGISNNTWNQKLTRSEKAAKK